MPSTRVSPRLGPRFVRALDFATRIHRDDTRKGKRTPYLSHLLGVCSLVLQHGGSEDEAIGALLHDTLEDHADVVTPAVLRRAFGPRVLAIVQGCTDTPADYRGGEKPPWRERKRAYLAHMGAAPATVRIVALADKLYNLRELNADLRLHGRKTLTRFNAGPDDQLWYFAGVLAAMRTAGDGGAMLDDYAREVGEFRRRVRAARAR